MLLLCYVPPSLLSLSLYLFVYTAQFERAAQEVLRDDHQLTAEGEEQQFEDVQVLLHSSAAFGPAGMRQLSSGRVGQLVQISGIVTSASKPKARPRTMHGAAGRTQPLSASCVLLGLRHCVGCTPAPSPPLPHIPPHIFCCQPTELVDVLWPLDTAALLCPLRCVLSPFLPMSTSCSTRPAT